MAYYRDLALQQPGQGQSPGKIGKSVFGQPQPTPNAWANEGMFSALRDGWERFDAGKNRDRLRKNPYGHLRGKEGGGRTPVDFMRQQGLDVSDPYAWTKAIEDFAQYRGPHNPQGKEASPYNMNTWSMHPKLGLRHGTMVDAMTLPERRRYARARFTYDNGLRSGLNDNRTYNDGVRNKSYGDHGGSFEWQRGLKIPDDGPYKGYVQKPIPPKEVV